MFLYMACFLQAQRVSAVTHIMKTSRAASKPIKMKDLSLPKRSDGRETRDRIIACAGKLFAQNGYYKTTGKSICEAAGVNLAAINYHFGSFYALYIAVLEDAHNHLTKLETFKKLESASIPPRKKIETLLDIMISASAKNTWYTQLWTREFLSPSPAFQISIKNSILPKFFTVVNLFSEYLQYPADDPRLYAAMISLLSPLGFVDIGRHHPAARQIPMQLPVPRLKELLRQNILLTMDSLRNPDAKDM